MGTYLQGPRQGKAQYLLSEYGGHRTTIEDIICGDAFSNNIDEVVVCVIRNQRWDAAAIIPPVRKEMIPSHPEFQLFAYDERPKTWLMIPFKNLPELIKRTLCKQQ